MFLKYQNNKKVQTNFLAYPIILQQDKRLKRKDLQIFLEKKGFKQDQYLAGIY